MRWLSWARPFAFLCVAATILSVSASAQTAPTPFVDRFTTIDEERWLVADGWFNGSWTANDWRRSQVVLDDERLQITLERTRGGRKRYSSGELQSRVYYRHGYFEIRMQAPRGSGLVTGFFTYARDGEHNTWDEIDVEILGRDTRSVQLTYFRGGVRHERTFPLPFDAAFGQHTYGFEWTETAIRWYVDGQLLHEETGANGPLPQSPQRLYLHLWNTETLNSWLGPILPWEGPWRLRVSCIAYAERYEGRSLCAPNT